MCMCFLRYVSPLSFILIFVIFKTYNVFMLTEANMQLSTYNQIVHFRYYHVFHVHFYFRSSFSTNVRAYYNYLDCLYTINTQNIYFTIFFRKKDFNFKNQICAYLLAIDQYVVISRYGCPYITNFQKLFNQQLL